MQQLKIFWSLNLSLFSEGLASSVSENGTEIWQQNKLMAVAKEKFFLRVSSHYVDSNQQPQTL